MDDEDGLLTEQLQVPRLLGTYTDTNTACSNATIAAFTRYLLEVLSESELARVWKTS